MLTCYFHKCQMDLVPRITFLALECSYSSTFRIVLCLYRYIAFFYYQVNALLISCITHNDSF